MENINIACSEVYRILEILGDKYKKKLPKKMLEFINANRKKDFILEIDENDLANFRISKDGLVFFALLNLRYWVENETERQKLIEQYKKNDEKYNEKINRYKDADWLKNSNVKKDVFNPDIETNNECQMPMILVKESLFDKIKKFIKKILKK